ncbi:MAG: phosphoribosylformylglycinamidine synthase subunit PurL [bacterium]|nr:phosphoribosylformylglycinamidine synthase subunit PurL [bacterium]
MPIRIQVTAADDPRAGRIVDVARLLGVLGLEACRVSRVHYLHGDLSAADIGRLCDGVLVDPVVDEVTVGSPQPTLHPAVEVAPRPGVTDTEARELERAAAALGLPPVRASTARRYELIGDLDEADVSAISRQLLANETIELHSLGVVEPSFDTVSSAQARVETVKLAGLTDADLERLSRERLLSLDRAEMRAIQEHFGREGRDATDAELETLAQTWSEHCMHKTFRARIRLEHTRADGSVTVSHHDGLLRALRTVTEEIDPAWLRSAFDDNAGIVAFDDDFDLAFKVETHNHPSALEPFGGANTGIGGVVRDVMGVSARPIACTDVLCFGPPEPPDRDLPPGVLHPRRVRDGVVAGIGDYGNKLGLPTVNGAVIYDEGYIANPLVYCGALGWPPGGSHPTDPGAGDRIVAIGGRTGRDGIHGATFSSAGMDETTAEQAGTAVQIGDPITQKGCIEVVEQARDRRLYNAITDCGAGGFSSAVGEMGEHLGAEVDLAGAPLKYEGLEPWEIWLSEAQERMVMAVPPDLLGPMRELCEHNDVEMTELGSFTATGHLVVRHGRTPVVDLPMDFLHGGVPGREMVARWADPLPAPGKVPDVDLSRLVVDLLSHPTVASKEAIVRTYDHEVRGGTVGRPFVGVHADGPGDGAVLKPLGTWHHDTAVALSVGINPRIGRLDPWAMALHAIDEAVRNLVAVGADPGRVALLDNFCWGDPTKPDRLGPLVRAVEGCVEGARRYRMPFISGKDSLFNEYAGEAIPGTLLISALGLVPDLHRTVDSAFTRAGNDLWLVGDPSDRLGGSLADDLLGIGDRRVPPAPPDPLPRYVEVHRLIAEGSVTAAHDVSDGGIAVAIAEMAIGGRLGVEASVPAVGTEPVATLANEAPGRLLLESPPARRDQVADRLGRLGRRIGALTGASSIEIRVAEQGGSAPVDAQSLTIGLEEAVRAFTGKTANP